MASEQWSSRTTFVLAAVGSAVGLGFSERSTACCVTGRLDVFAADKIESIANVMPAKLHEVCQPLGMIGMDVGQKNGVQITRNDTDLREPLRRSSPDIELQQHVVTLIRHCPVANQCTCPGHSIDRRWAALRTGQHDFQAGFRNRLCTCRKRYQQKQG